METLERICRVCLNSETQEEFHPIFDSDSNSIALKIFLISSVKVSITRNLSNKSSSNSKNCPDFRFSSSMNSTCQRSFARRV